MTRNALLWLRAALLLGEGYRGRLATRGWRGRNVSVWLLVALCACVAPSYGQVNGWDTKFLPLDRLERAVHEEAIVKIAREEQVTRDPRIEEIGARIVACSDRPVLPLGMRYTFRIIESPACSDGRGTPGGGVYVSRGLYRLLTDDSELAFVLGHEVAHVCRRHTVKQGRQEAWHEFAGAISGPLINELLRVIAAGHSRDDESEADSLAVWYAYLAGFDPTAAASAMQKLSDCAGGSDRNCLVWCTHPDDNQRIEALRRIAGRLDTGPREYVFVLDVSASMAGSSLAVAKQLLRRLLRYLRPQDYLSLVFFSDVCRLGGSMPAAESYVLLAQAAIDAEQGSGGTKMSPALESAISLPPIPGAQRVIVLVTDGGDRPNQEAIDAVRRSSGWTRYVVLGVGDNPTRDAIDLVARVGGGQAFFVKDKSVVSEAAGSLRRYLATR